MAIQRSRWWRLFVLSVIVTLTFTAVFSGLVVYAQGKYPQPMDQYVNDYAGLLTARDAANVKTLFADLKRETGIEAVVVTIDSINDYATGDATIESFATNLFNTWGIGDKTKNDGVLLLVAVGDRKVRIEVGAGYESTQNDNMQEVINEHVLPSFRNEEYSRGIYRGARAIVGELTGEWPPDLSTSTSNPAPAERSTEMDNPSPRISSTPATTRATASYNSIPSAIAAYFEDHLLASLGSIVAVLGGAGFGLQQYLRYRKRRCPDCGMDMVRLDEAGDDVYLDSGQKLEEVLRSVDYDIWKCPHCNTHTLHGYRNWFSSLKRCPRCGYRTVKVTSTTLVSPTYTSTGKERITRNCRHCDYHSSETVTLPMKTRSSSSSSGSSRSSGSSFGGGRSSGGGASGSW